MWIVALALRRPYTFTVFAILILIAGIVAIILFTERWIPEVKALRDYSLLAALFVAMILLGILISLGSTHRSVIKYLKMKLDDLY